VIHNINAGVGEELIYFLQFGDSPILAIPCNHYSYMNEYTPREAQKGKTLIKLYL